MEWGGKHPVLPRPERNRKKTKFMNRKLLTVLVGVGVVATAVAGFLIFRKTGPRASVTVTLRIAVSPSEQVGFVAAQANSARFKYEMGTNAGVKPILANKLTVKAVPNSALVEMQVGVQTRSQGWRYVESFVKKLQAQCGRKVQLTLKHQAVQ